MFVSRYKMRDQCSMKEGKKTVVSLEEESHSEVRAKFIERFLDPSVTVARYAVSRRPISSFVDEIRRTTNVIPFRAIKISKLSSQAGNSLGHQLLLGVVWSTY